MRKYITVAKAAEISSYPKSVINRLISDGKIGANRFSDGSVKVDQYSLIDLLDNNIEVFEQIYKEQQERKRKKSATESPDNIPVQELCLTKRILSAFRAAGITTLGDIYTRSYNELRALPNIGTKSMRTITAVLKRYNLTLRHI